MATVENDVAPLVAGDKLTADEFLRRWEAMPLVKRAELIGGVVYVPSPVTAEHGDLEVLVGTWLAVYASATAGCRASSNATWLMLGDVPQPDATLRILPEFGGQSSLREGYLDGAPELAGEICRSSTAYDLHQKLDLYQSAGVKEYVAALVREQEVRWHRLVRRLYRVMPVPADGVLRSTVFPGLWLHAPSLLAGDMPRVLATLQEGLGSPEHEAFVARLARRRRR
jgi:Uma2 family endonuclease